MSGTATLCSLLAFLLLVPTAASAKIYKWTDEKGTTVFSNTPPGVEREAKDVEVVVEDEKAPTLTAQQAAYAEAQRREQQLEERIYNLERQVQTQQQQYQPQYQPLTPPPSPDYYGGDSAAPPTGGSPRPDSHRDSSRPSSTVASRRPSSMVASRRPSSMAAPRAGRGASCVFSGYPRRDASTRWIARTIPM